MAADVVDVAEIGGKSSSRKQVYERPFLINERRALSFRRCLIEEARGEGYTTGGKSNFNMKC